FDSPHWETVWTSTPLPSNPRYGTFAVDMVQQNSLWRLSSPFQWSYDYSTETVSCQVLTNNGSSYWIYAQRYENFSVTDPEGSSHPIYGQNGTCTDGDSDRTFAGSADDGMAIKLEVQHLQDVNARRSYI